MTRPMVSALIYVSCPSAFLGEARRAMELVRARGWAVVGGEWVDAVEAHGSQAARFDAERRDRIVESWWHHISTTDAVVALEPVGCEASDGAAYEAALADAAGCMRVVVTESPKPRLVHAGWPVARTIEQALHLVESEMRRTR